MAGQGPDAGLGGHGADAGIGVQVETVRRRDAERDQGGQYEHHATIDVDWEIAIRKAYGVVEAPLANQIEPPKKRGLLLDAEVVPAVEAKP